MTRLDRDRTRFAAYRHHPAQLEAMRALQATIDASGIDPALGELCKVRASQINGCAYCLAMHTYEARERGEREERLHLVAAWREAPCYTDAERAALALTEAMTLLPTAGVPDDVWSGAVAALGEEQAGAVVWLVVAINAWNRLVVTTRTEPEHWFSQAGTAAAAT